MPDIHVEEANAADPELLSAIIALVPQLSASAPPVTASDLDEICESPATHLFVARDESKKIVGTLTLAVFRIPTGVRAWIEDVVVATDARGRGVGEKLVRHAIEHSIAAGARTVDLTSRPSRHDAIRLYEKLGFERYETNVFRFVVERKKSG